MVSSTRARCYDSDTSGYDCSSGQPTKRRRVQVKPAECYSTVPDRNTDGLSRHHGLGIFDYTCTSITADRRQTDTENVQRQLPEKTPSMSRLPSLCRSSPSVSEDDVCRHPDLQHESPWTDAVLDPSRRSNGPGDVKSAQEDPREECNQQHVGVQQPTEHTRFTVEETDSKEDEQLRDLTTPARREREGVEERHSGSTTERPRAFEISRDAAVSLRSCDQIQAMGPSVPPPTAPCTPPEYVYEDVVNPNFGREFGIAYTVSILRDGHRRHKYGADVSETWKRGSTPEEARERWRLSAAKNSAEAEEFSDSD